MVIMKNRPITPRGFRKPVNPILDFSHPLSYGLVGYWPLGDSVSISKDISRNSNMADVNGSMTLGPSHHGGLAPNGFVSSGANWFQARNSVPLQFNGLVSFLAWFYPTQGPVAGTRGISNLGSSPYKGFEIGFNDISYYVQYGINTPSPVFAQQGTGISTNTWSCIVGTYDGTNLSMYVNTLLVAQQASSTPMAKAADVFKIGGLTPNSSGAGFKGLIEGVRVYNRALSITEIGQLYSEPYAGVYEKSTLFYGGYSPARGPIELTLSNTVQTVVSNQTVALESYFLYNPNPTVTYLQFFDTKSNGSVQLGVTTPNWSTGISPGNAANITELDLNFANGVCVAATTTATGNTAPAAPVTVNFGWL